MELTPIRSRFWTYALVAASLFAAMAGAYSSAVLVAYSRHHEAVRVVNAIADWSSPVVSRLMLAPGEYGITRRGSWTWGPEGTNLGAVSPFDSWLIHIPAKTRETATVTVYVQVPVAAVAFVFHVLIVCSLIGTYALFGRPRWLLSSSVDAHMKVRAVSHVILRASVIVIVVPAVIGTLWAYWTHLGMNHLGRFRAVDVGVAGKTGVTVGGVLAYGGAVVLLIKQCAASLFRSGQRPRKSPIACNECWRCGYGVSGSTCTECGAPDAGGAGPAFRIIWLRSRIWQRRTGAILLACWIFCIVAAVVSPAWLPLLR